jgi:hypothetical protein
MVSVIKESCNGAFEDGQGVSLVDAPYGLPEVPSGFYSLDDLS